MKTRKLLTAVISILAFAVPSLAQPIPSNVLTNCQTPTMLEVSQVDLTNALLTWNAGGSENEWEVLIMPSPSPAPVATDSGIPTEFPFYQNFNLIPSSMYQFYVRAKCGSQFSLWSAPLSFTTLGLIIDPISPNPQSPTFQNFCGGATVANLAATGTNLKWYDNSFGGPPLASTTVLSTKTYYVTQRVSSSFESARTATNVTVNPTPTFTQVSPICSGGNLTSLPTTSNNGITGTWLPAINNTATTTYTFTPTVGLCATTDMMTIVVNPNLTPTFTQLAPVCSGCTLAALPTTSTNGITGTWLPAPNNTATTTYTFTPSDGQCANTTTMTIAVNTAATPTQNLCSRDTQSYSVNATDSSHAGSTYAWSISPTIPNIVITGQGTNSITIDWSNAPYGSYTLQTVETNAAGCLSTPVNATINLTQPTAAPSAPATQTFCTAATVANLTATGTNLQWFTTATGGTALTATTALTTGNYYVSQTVGLCESNRTAVAVSVNPILTPAFTQVAPICAGGILSTLPTTSNNGITGTWLPAINNTATTTYTFTPTANQCAETSTMTILVNPNVTPTFTQVAPICSGGILASLPTTSNNGITGTWLPAIINTATTAYTFTPTAGLCATTTAMTIVVNPSVTPTFTQVAPICSGGILSPLPTTSNNGITGTWLPAINNTATTTYTFTQTASLCATTAAMTIVVNPNVTPTFTQVGPICSGTTLTALPTTSNNGITGTWLPAVNPNITTTYTFTPTAGQCAGTTTQTIIITATVVTSAISFVAPAPVAALPSVTIGTQVWTNKNLDVTTYRDGTPIPQVTDPTQWANLTTGAWCYYNNDPANDPIYGKLYNWYAVAGIHDNDPNTPNKILAPLGWHVPTDDDWSTLTTFLGGESVAGGKMKDIGTMHWISPNTGATNSSGFTGLPGGARNNTGSFDLVGNNGFWWSSSNNILYSPLIARYCNLRSGGGNFTRIEKQKALGFSVRCLRD